MKSLLAACTLGLLAVATMAAPPALSPVPQLMQTNAGTLFPGGWKGGLYVRHGYLTLPVKTSAD